MTGIHPTRCTRQLTSFQGQYWRHGTALQWLEKGNALFLSLVMVPAMVLLTSLCIVSPGQAQTPQTTFTTAIYNPTVDGTPQAGSICPRLLNPNQLSGGTKDLKERCNDLATTPSGANAPPAPMRQPSQLDAGAPADR